DHRLLRPRVAVDADVILEALHVPAHPVVQPHGHRRRIDLRAFRLEPAVDVVVRIAFDRLQIELAGDLRDRLDAQAIDLDRVEAAAHLAHRIDEVARPEVPDERPPFLAAIGTLAEDLAEIVDALLDDLSGLPRFHFIRAYLILEALEQIGAQNSP